MTWEKLISGMNIEGTLDPCPREAMETLQSTLHFRLPSGYREFCELLGPGLIAEQIGIVCSGNRYQDAEFRSQVTRSNALSTADEEVDFGIQRRDGDATGKYVLLKELSISRSDDDYDIWFIVGLFDGAFHSRGGAMLGVGGFDPLFTTSVLRRSICTASFLIARNGISRESRIFDDSVP